MSFFCGGISTSSGLAEPRKLQIDMSQSLPPPEPPASTDRGPPGGTLPEATRFQTLDAQVNRGTRSAFSNGLVITVSLWTLVFFCASSVLNTRSVLGQNDASRWDTVWSLINGKGYVIDDAPYPTIDKVYRQPHFYSSKPALLPTVVAVVAGIASHLTGLPLAPGPDYWLIRITLLIINGVPFAVLVYAYGRWLTGLPCHDFAKCFCLYCAACGTYLTAYNITLNNHTVAAVGAFFALYLLLRILTGKSSHQFSFFLCGIFSSWTVASELIAWPFWLFVFWYLSKANKRKALQFFIPGALVVVAAFLVLTYLATGDCIPFYLKSALYRYPGSYWEDPRGIDAAHEPKWMYFLNHVLGHHGILSLSPVFVFAFAGMASARTLRPLRAGGIVLTALNFVFVIFGTHNYGGACQGARWFMWLIPLWLFCLPMAVDALAKSRRWKAVAVLALAVSIGSVAYAVFAHPEGPWSRSWLHDAMRFIGWVSY